MTAIAAPRFSRPDRTTVVIAVITVLAAVWRLYRLSRPGMLYGIIGYDDGVYFGASVQLVHGNLLYHDFVFVHPPLLPILMSPFALLARFAGTAEAFGLARIVTALLSAASVAMLGRLLRHRGAAAVGLGCAVLAWHSDTVASGQSVFLEPYIVVFCLAGLLVLFAGDGLTDSPKRLFWGGVLFGLACAVKVFALAPLLVLLVLALRTPRHALRIALGGAAGFLVPCLPFLLAAPLQFGRDVIISQLTRTALRTSINTRLSNMIGTNGLSALDGGAARVAVVVAFLVLAGAYTLACRVEHRRPSQLEFFAIGASLLTIAIFLVADQFFWHYAAFFAPFAALAIALPTTALLTRDVTRIGWSIVVAAVVVVVFLGGLSQLQQTRAKRVPLALIHSTVPRGACVASNDTSLALVADRVSTADRCAPLIDGLGMEIVDGHGQIGRHAAKYAKVRQAWLRPFQHADYALIYRPTLVIAPWSDTIRPYLVKYFRHVPSGSRLVGIWVRKTVR